MLAAIFGHRVRPIVWAAAIVALSGCGLLCGEGGGPNIGDLWSLGTAITWAIYIFRLESVSAKCPAAPAGGFAGDSRRPLQRRLVCGSPQPVIEFHLPALIYLGLAATAGTTWLQTVAQKVVALPASRRHLHARTGFRRDPRVLHAWRTADDPRNHRRGVDHSRGDREPDAGDR